ncbi:hypothetical protein AM588_10004805 [Phytophthora nicotianae]|uniref:Ty3 transposon capsid-like protein domain-containing protein n=1 Tax=Phytophthora nicotianae TaxID=4792 RepID=A0A0W8D7P8_PHYNI|nr:hypothetical protein AM588_10004805 [Phytophthora nicotianae]
METRSRAERRFAIEDGTRNPIDERVQRVEETLNDMGEHLGQVNQRLDRIFDGINSLVQTVAATQQATQQSAATASQFQDFAAQTAAAVADLQTQIGVMNQFQELAQQTANAVAQMERPTAAATPIHQPTPNGETDVDMTAPTTRKWRKMDTKPPTFDGDIDGQKLKSFVFQFESYFTFKGYNLEGDDSDLARELGQCVKKSAATWYETYMTSVTTVKTWSAMKLAMDKCFKEPNFQQKMRNDLLNFEQRGNYQGYVAKFLEKLRQVPIDRDFAKEIFLQGLKSSNLRKQILRKNPTTLEDVIEEGFREVELDRLQESKTPASIHKDTPEQHAKGKSPDNCWVKHPEKRPQSLRKAGNSDKTDYKAKYYALVDKLIVDDNNDSEDHLNE